MDNFKSQNHSNILISAINYDRKVLDAIGFHL